MKKIIKGMCVAAVITASVVGFFGFNKLTANAGDNIRVDSFTVTKDAAAVGDLISFDTKAIGGTEPYEYEFTANNTTTGDTAKFGDFSAESFITYYCAMGGTYNFVVRVKDADGNIASCTMKDYFVKGMEITEMKSDVASPQTVGTPITFSAKAVNEIAYRYCSCNYKITNNTTKESETISAINKSIGWTPSKEGNYTVTVTAKDYVGQIATKSMDFTISGINNSANIATIYYKSSKPAAFIHYQIGNGEWTPYYGNSMNSCTTSDGFNYVYTVDLGTADSLTACFHDGCGNWDSKYGENYHFKAGTYYVSDYKVVQK